MRETGPATIDPCVLRFENVSHPAGVRAALHRSRGAGDRNRAGAPSTDLPIAVAGAEQAGSGQGAAVVGVIHFLDLMHEGHFLRDQAGFQEGGPESQRIAPVMLGAGLENVLK